MWVTKVEAQNIQNLMITSLLTKDDFSLSIELEFLSSKIGRYYIVTDIAWQPML